MGDLNIKPNTQGKVAQTDYDFWLTQSDDTCLFCLSKRQIAILLTALPMSEWRTRWFSPTGQTPDMDLIRAEIAKIETELMTDHCDLQTQIDNILTEITTINNNITTINNNIVTVNNNLTIVENKVTLVQQQNTTINVTLNLPTYTFTASAQDTTSTANFARYNGFCSSIVAWIMSACYRILEIENAPPSDLASIVVQMDIMSVSLALGFPFVTGPTFTNAEMLAATLDQTAVYDVACAMITKLYNLTPTAANFNAALSAYTPPAYPDHRAILKVMCALYLNLADGFTPWATINGFYFQQALAANPTGYDCPPCNPPTPWSIPQSWDFSVMDRGPWLIHRGLMSQGTGLLGVTSPDDPSNWTFDIEAFLPASGVTFTSPNKLNFFTRVRPGATGQWIIHYYTTPTQTTPTEVTFTTTGNDQTISWTLNGTYYKSIRAYPVTNGGYFGFVSLATASYAKLSKITLTAT